MTSLFFLNTTKDSPTMEGGSALGSTETEQLCTTLTITRVKKPWYAWRGLVVGKMKKSIPEYAEDEIQDETVVEEVRLICSTAMLMCLTREQRLLYIIGEIFGADHKLGAALFELSPANYRVKLHRAKADLLQFVAGRCGLVDPQNPCRCPKKAKVMVQQGWVNPENLLFNAHFSAQVKDLVQNQRYRVSDEIQLRMKALFRESPFQIHQELDQLWLELTQKLN